ncbi:MAG: hypothetical protein RR054_00415 [Clostridia bacterium]
MDIKIYKFTHTFDGVNYDFIVHDLGKIKTVTLNGKYDLIANDKNNFDFVDLIGNTHNIRFKNGLVCEMVYIDGIKYDYIGSSNWYDIVLALLPVLAITFQWFFILPINFFVNIIIIRETDTLWLKTVLCVISTVVFTIIGNTILSYLRYTLGI